MMGIELLEGQGSSMSLGDRSDRIHGVVVGVVTNNNDPDKQGRVKVKFPWLSDTDESNWARVMTTMAGNDRGLYLLPEVDDEVLVMFEHGMVDHPFVIGALWNGKDKPPVETGDGKNNLRVLKSRSGHTITLDDTSGSEKITIADKSKKNVIVLDSKTNEVSITSGKDLAIKAEGNISLATTTGNIELTCTNFKVTATGELSMSAKSPSKIETTATLAITGTAGVNVNSGALEVV